MPEDFRPKMLLHACCASCAAYVIDQLKNDFDLTVFFYNPNIHPLDEYFRRIADLERFCKFHDLRFFEGEYDVDNWLKQIKGRERDQEGGERCQICFRKRLEKTAQMAQDWGFDYFTSTLSMGPNKNAQVINQIGTELGQDYGVNFYEADFKKNDGFKNSCLIARQWRFYRQNYCGCVYSQPPKKETGS